MLPEGLSTVKLFFAAFSLFLLFFFSASPPISACGSQPGFHLGQPRFFPVYIVYMEKKEKLFYRKNEQKNTKTAQLCQEKTRRFKYCFVQGTYVPRTTPVSSNQYLVSFFKIPFLSDGVNRKFLILLHFSRFLRPASFPSNEADNTKSSMSLSSIYIIIY